jgi:hypothetical protein
VCRPDQEPAGLETLVRCVRDAVVTRH